MAIVMRGYSIQGPGLTPTATPTTLAPPSPTPTATPAVGPWQLLLNPGFETGDAWQIPQTESPAAYSEERAFSGRRSMRLGIGPTGNVYSYSSCQQVVTIPSWVTEANLFFRYFPIMSWPDLDEIYVCVLEASSDAPLQCWTWQELEPSWHAGYFDLISFSGQRVKVHFGMRNDGIGGSAVVFVDDVELWVQ